jgi:hypothetical protein
VIVSVRQTLGDAADVVADPDVALIAPSVIEAIADRAPLALGHLRGLPATLGDGELAGETSLQFSQQALDSESLLDTLGQRMLRSDQPSHGNS